MNKEAREALIGTALGIGTMMGIFGMILAATVILSQAVEHDLATAPLEITENEINRQ